MKQPISKFQSVADKHPVAVSAQSVAQTIFDGTYRVPVEAVRAAVAAGDKSLASRLKLSLEYICYTGVCEGGHKAGQLQEYRPCVVLDYDNVPIEQLPALRARAMAEPCVETAYISASGTGLKVVVITNGTREQHPVAYAQGAAHFDALLGYACDGACKDITHGHFVSYDPDAAFREVNQPFHVCTERFDTCTEPFNTRTEPFEACAASVPVAADAARFVQSYLTLYPAYEGNRNTRLFRLACQAHKRGIGRGQLVQAVTQAMQEPGFGAHEITQVVNSAYCRSVVPAAPKTGVGQERFCQDSAILPMAVETSTTADDETPENPDGEELRARTPLLPEEVYEGLPEFLRTTLNYHPEGRERDMLLLSSITVLGSLFHTTSGYYHRRLCYPNLYLFIVAPPANNKSIITYSLDLCKHFIEQAMEENVEKERKHNEALEAYEYAIRQMRRKNKDLSPGEIPRKPEPPVYYYPHIPTSISQARLMEHVQHNGTRGGLMFDTEADALSVAAGQEYGQFQDMIRRMFHHERVSSSHKINGRPRYVQNPKFSMVLSGTPAQLVRYFGTTENGGYSRQLLYTYLLENVWQDVSPQSSDEGLIERHFNNLSMRLHQVLRWLHTSPTRVKLSRRQWNKLNAVFSELLNNERYNDRSDFQSCVKRYCLMAFRICMILTTLEKSALHMDVPEMECSDAHFEAALAIATTCLEHSRLVITSLKSTEKEVPDLQNPNKFKSILADLPQQFTSKQYHDLAAQYELSPRTAARLLKNSNNLLTSKIHKGMYKKLP